MLVPAGSNGIEDIYTNFVERIQFRSPEIDDEIVGDGINGHLVTDVCFSPKTESWFKCIISFYSLSSFSSSSSLSS